VAELRGDLSLDTSDAASSIEALEPIFESVGAGFAQALVEALDVLGAIPAPEIDTSQIDAALADSATTGAEVLASSISDAATEGGTAGAEAVQESLAGIEVPEIDVPVTADTDPAVAEIQAIDVEQLTLEVNADTTAAQDDIEQLGDSAVGSTSDIGGLTGATQGFQAAGDLATGSAAGLGGAIGGMSGAATAAVGAVTVTAGVLSVFFNEAVDAAGATQQWNVSLGEAARRVENMRDIEGLNFTLGELALTLGSDDDALRKVVARLYQTATASGITTDKSALYVEQLTALAARAVALNPALGTVDEVVARLSNGLARGGRFAANYGIALTAAEIQARALTDTGKTQAAELTVVEKSMAGAEIAAEKYGKGLNDVVVTGSENAIITQRRLSQAFRETFERLGAPLVVPIFQILEDSRPIVEDVGRIFAVLGATVLPIVIAALLALEPPLRLVANILEILQPILPFVLGLFLAYEALTIIPAILTAIATAFTAISVVAPIAGGAAASAAVGIDAAAISTTGLGAAFLAVAAPAAILGGIAAGTLFLLGAFGEISSGVNVELAATGGHTKRLTEDLSALGDMQRNVNAQADQYRESLGMVGATTQEVANRSGSSGLVAALSLVDTKFEKVANDAEKLAAANPEAAQSFLEIARNADITGGRLDQLTEAVERGTKEYDRRVKKQAEAQVASENFQNAVAGEVDKLHGSTAATQEATDAWQQYVDSLTATVPTVTSTYQAVFQTAQDNITNFVNNIGKTPPPPIPAPDPDALIAGLQAAFQAAEDYTANVRTLFAGHFTELARTAVEQGPVEGAAFADLWSHATDAQKAAAETWLENLRHQGGVQAGIITDEWAPQLADATDAAAERARAAFTERWGLVVSDTGVVFDQVTGDIVGFQPQLADAGKQAGTAGATGYGEGIDPIPGKTANTLLDAQHAFGASGVPGEAGSTGGYAAFLFGAGFANSAPIAAAILNDVGTIIDQSASPLGSAANIAGLAIGSQLGWGISAGISPWIRRVEDQLQELINKAHAAAAAEAEAKSPSKLFMRLGSDIGEGLALGIESMAPRITAAPAMAVTDAAQIGATSRSMTSTSSSTQVTFDIDVHGVADPTVARQVGQQIGEGAIDALARRGVVVAARMQRSG